MKRSLCIAFITIFFIGCRSLEVSQSTPTREINDVPIVQPTVPIEALPNFLGTTIPGVGENYSIAEYEALAPATGWNATKPGICFSIAPFRFMEPGDAPTAEEWLSQVHLIVDSRVITQYHSLMKHDSTGRSLSDPKTGKLIWHEPPGSPLLVCYEVPLEKGYHAATIVVKKTSGEQITYSWPFTITQ